MTNSPRVPWISLAMEERSLWLQSFPIYSHQHFAWSHLKASTQLVINTKSLHYWQLPTIHLKPKWSFNIDCWNFKPRFCISSFFISSCNLGLLAQVSCEHTWKLTALAIGSKLKKIHFFNFFTFSISSLVFKCSELHEIW